MFGLGWIPVKKKMPKESGYYLCYTTNSVMDMMVCYYMDYVFDGYFIGGDDGRKINVVAWRKLPRAYKNRIKILKN